MAHGVIATKYDSIHGLANRLQRRLSYIKNLKDQLMKSVPNRTIKS